MNPSEKKTGKYCTHFNYNSLRAHLHSIVELALRLDRPIYPEVTEALQYALRAMVNAYAWARRGADLRVPSIDASIETLVSDDEDGGAFEIVNAGYGIDGP